MDETPCRFEPQKDITAYELAMVLQIAQMAFARDLVKSCPQSVARHFKDRPSDSRNAE